MNSHEQNLTGSHLQATSTDTPQAGKTTPDATGQTATANLSGDPFTPYFIWHANVSFQQARVRAKSRVFLNIT